MQDKICFDKTVTGFLNTGDILAATGGRIISDDVRVFTGLSIDSRKMQKGELFVALKGGRFDGHDFLHAALDKGAGALVSLPGAEPVPGKTVICVENTLKALQDIARYMRQKKDVPAIAVTGSNGKTTTKELIASVLGKRYSVLKNAGNLNNHIGLPLSLAGITDQEDMIVLEMGASGPGEIRELCNIALPDYGVLTNIGYAHLEGFKNIETVRRTKLELLDAVGTAVVNADDHFLMEGILLSGFTGRLIRFGVKNPADVYAEDIRLHEKGMNFILHCGEGKPVEVGAKISGMFNIYNILAAAAVGTLFDIDPVEMAGAAGSFTGVPMRLEFREFNGIRIISDMYNANPASMAEAIKELVRDKKGRIIALLGDMLELGLYEEEEHRKLGRIMSGLPIDIFIAVGKRMAFAASEFQGTVYAFETPADAGRLLKDIWRRGDSVLIKGSRGMHMETVLADGS